MENLGDFLSEEEIYNKINKSNLTELLDHQIDNYYKKLSYRINN